METEIKSRKLMEKRAIELAFENINVENNNEMNLALQIRDI